MVFEGHDGVRIPFRVLPTSPPVGMYYIETRYTRATDIKKLLAAIRVASDVPGWHITIGPSTSAERRVELDLGVEWRWEGG